MTTFHNADSYVQDEVFFSLNFAVYNTIHFSVVTDSDPPHASMYWVSQCPQQTSVLIHLTDSTGHPTQQSEQASYPIYVCILPSSISVISLLKFFFLIVHLFLDRI